MKFPWGHIMRHRAIKKCVLRTFFVLAVALGMASLSCVGNGFYLFEDIKTGIVSARAYSHDDASYTPVPDSLRLRFQVQLRMLRTTVVTTGCGPQLEAGLEETPARLTIRFDMNDTCVHVRPEYYDVDIFVSPVHPDTFRLVVLQVGFASLEDFVVLLNRRIDVRTLPGF